jgi:hypothetical protein
MRWHPSANFDTVCILYTNHSLVFWFRHLLPMKEESDDILTYILCSSHLRCHLRPYSRAAGPAPRAASNRTPTMQQSADLRRRRQLLPTSSSTSRSTNLAARTARHVPPETIVVQPGSAEEYKRQFAGFYPEGTTLVSALDGSPDVRTQQPDALAQYISEYVAFRMYLAQAGLPVKLDCPLRANKQATCKSGGFDS